MRRQRGVLGSVAVGVLTLALLSGAVGYTSCRRLGEQSAGIARDVSGGSRRGVCAESCHA